MLIRTHFLNSAEVLATPEATTNESGALLEIRDPEEEESSQRETETDCRHHAFLEEPIST